MASSLEDLLAEDGFKRRKSLTRSTTFFKEESPTLPPFPFPENLKKELTPRDSMRTRRSSSDVSRPRDRHIDGREQTKTDSTCEIVEVEEEENVRVKQNSIDDWERDMFMNEMRDRRTHVVVGRRSFGDKNRKELKQQQLGNSEKISSNGKAVSELALDEAAIQAVVSILCRYIKRFLRDKEFRSTLRHNCLSSLSVVEGMEEERDGDQIKILAKLEDAIGVIERGVEESTSMRELKKAVLQLSVIAGLNSEDSKEDFTSGIPYHRLSACAHLYLSVVHKLQKKDVLAAKQLLQVFCDSPFLARTKLLPELWDCLFFPHLSHLNAWYNQEAGSLANTPSKPRKLKLLAKMYKEILDSGTFQFAVYYKDWLTKGVETAPVPSIHVPSVSIREAEKGSSSRGWSSEMSCSPNEPFSPQIQTMVSMKLYNTVFRNSSKSGSEDGRDLENSGDLVRAKVTDQAIFQEKWSSTEKDHHGIGNGNLVESENCQEKSENINSQPNTKQNELSTKKHFDLQPLELELTKGRSSNEEPLGLYLEKRSPFSSSIPRDFICPLTGQLFEEPVTLETGETFERKAIKSWFDEGNTTCPVTARNLECKQLVPLTNMVLKRVIDTWKLQNLERKQLIPFANTEEFTALGVSGLEILLRRFGSGNLEERAHVASLLVGCVESDSSCRDKIAKEIDRKCLVELLLTKQVKARESAVLLLLELIPLKRKKEVIELLREMKSEEEGIEKTMHVVLVYLQSSQPLLKPLVAVLLLHFDLLVEPRRYSIYREEAIDATTEALNSCLNNDKIRKNCCRALLILGARFPSSGQLLTHSRILKQEGFKAIGVVDLSANKEEQQQEQEDGSLVDEASSLDDEEHSNEQWQRNLCASIIRNGKRSFLEAICRCLASEDIDLVTACLITVAWLSDVLRLMPATELQLCALSFLISRLKECLENGQCVEHKVLASTSLLNFNKNSECRALLMSMA